MTDDAQPTAPSAPASSPQASPRPSRRKRIGRWLLEVALISAVFFGVRAFQTRNTISGPAPQLAGQALDGEAFSLAAAKGEPVLVHFWATWCGVCKAEEGNIESLAKRHRTITIAASSGDSAKVRSYLQSRGVDLPVLVDSEGDLAAAWGVSAFPTSFIVDPDGNVRFVEVGYTTELGMALRLWLARVL